MNPVRPLLRRPVFLLSAVLLFALYAVFDLREGGRSASLTNWHIVTPARYARLFGLEYVIGAIALDAILALATAWCLTFAVQAWQRRRSVGPTCAPGAVVIMGVAVFGCPGCVLPLAGTLGVSFLAINLPLYGLEFKLLALALVLGTGLLWQRRLRGRTADTTPAARQPTASRS